MNRLDFHIEITELAFDLETANSWFDPTGHFHDANEAYRENDLIRLEELRDELELNLRKVRG